MSADSLMHKWYRYRPKRYGRCVHCVVQAKPACGARQSGCFRGPTCHPVGWASRPEVTALLINVQVVVLVRGGRSQMDPQLALRAAGSANSASERRPAGRIARA
jgi:hypothetical protein